MLNIINKCYNKENLDNLESFIMALIEKDVDIVKNKGQIKIKYVIEDNNIFIKLN